MTEQLSKEQWNAAANEALREAIRYVNKTEILIWDCQENKDILISLLKEAFPNTTWHQRPTWVIPQTWATTIQLAISEGLLKKKPTREQRVAEFEANDRAEGSPRRNSLEKSKTVEESDEAKARTWVKEQMDGLKNIGKTQLAQPTAPVANLKSISDFPLDVDVQNFTPELRKAFTKLSADQIRLWSKRRAEYVHKEKYPAGAYHPQDDGGR